MPNNSSNKPLIVGLTGGIGSGKSAASACFAKLGVTIVDADVIAREAVQPNTPALQAIAKHFGPEILLPNGALNRAQLRHIIFAQPEAKTWLESLLHPLINQRLQQQLHSARSAYAVLASPLLLETSQHQLVDRILVIDCPPEVQIQRAAQRDNIDPAQIKAIMATQINRTERLKRADDVLHNHGDLQELEGEVAKLHQQYLRLSV